MKARLLLILTMGMLYSASAQWKPNSTDIYASGFIESTKHVVMIMVGNEPNGGKLTLEQLEKVILVEQQRLMRQGYGDYITYGLLNVVKAYKDANKFAMHEYHKYTGQ